MHSFPAHAGQADGAPTLATGLYRLASTRRVELLFDERLVAGMRYVPPATGTTIEQALSQMLNGTGLTFRKLPSGAYVIVANAPASAPADGAAPAPVVADILVIGRRTLNTDIRRGPDDPQPYRTASRRDIENAQSATIDEFLKTRVPQNAQAMLLSQAPFSSGGAVRSQVNLRGLGEEQTLVLVNGRRLPSVPGLGELLQADVSGLPVHSIDRIETLASTAGGIFGIGAAGGVVNLITKNDYRDATLVLRSGISERGDAAQRLLDAHVGFTSRSDHTRVSLRYTLSSDDGLTLGSRPFIEESRELRYQRLGSQNYLPVSSGVNIVSTYGTNLTLSPAYGGQALGASSTYLPLSAPPLSSGGASTLLANAGHLDLALAPDGQGALQSLLTPTKRNAIMATVRQDVGSALEVYADYLRLETTGTAVVGGVQTHTDLSVGQQGNPFAQPITITYPAAGLLGKNRTNSITDRLTLGAILQFGGGWVANLDAATGRAVVDQTQTYAPISTYAINAFAGGTALASQLSVIPTDPFYHTHATNRLRDLNFRVAGPLARLPAGPVSITVTGELRDERAPGAIYEYYLSVPSLNSSQVYQSARQTVASLFAEARVPITREDGPISPLRGLMVQLALRGDHYAITAPILNTQLLDLGTFGSEAKNSGTVTAVTASARAKPLDGLTLRGSFADGYTPPTQSQITPSGESVGFFFYSDPKRPGDAVLSSVQTLYLSGGRPGTRPQHARTFSVGAIVKPAVIPGLRVSLDFSALHTDHEITDFGYGLFQYFVTNEALYPGRITRAPLTAADIAKGYTAGRITEIDATYLSTGHTTLNTLDVALDYERKTGIGLVRAYGQASWETTLRHGASNAPSYEAVNAFNGPVGIRASGGVELSRGHWTTGVDAQFYGSYRITSAYQTGSLYTPSYAQLNTTNLIEQGTSHIPAQAYVDAWTSFVTERGSGGRPLTTFRLDVKNVLNKTPPLVVPPLTSASDGIGYSPLGDPRGRRFELEVTTSF